MSKCSKCGKSIGFFKSGNECSKEDCAYVECDNCYKTITNLSKCSKCSEDYTYCSEHINNHRHSIDEGMNKDKMVNLIKLIEDNTDGEEEDEENEEMEEDEDWKDYCKNQFKGNKYYCYLNGKEIQEIKEDVDIIDVFDFMFESGYLFISSSDNEYYFIKKQYRSG